jgi:hypothetical protein
LIQQGRCRQAKSKLLTYVNCINDADDGCINRRVFAAFCHARRTALNDQDRFPKARADGVNGDDVAFLVMPIFVNESRNQEFATVQAFVFSRGNDGSNYSC